MKKLSPAGLMYSMMAANALFTLATLLGAFSGTFSQIVPFVIVAMTLGFLVYAFFFFALFKSFSIWMKLSGIVFVLASTVLGLILSVMSSVVLPEDENYANTLRVLALFIIPLGTLLFASFFQTYYFTVMAAGQLRLGLLYLTMLAVVLIISIAADNIFGLNLGLTTLLVCGVIFVLNRKHLLAKAKRTRK